MVGAPPWWCQCHTGPSRGQMARQCLSVSGDQRLLTPESWHRHSWDTVSHTERGDKMPWLNSNVNNTTINLWRRRGKQIIILCGGHYWDTWWADHTMVMSLMLWVSLPGNIPRCPGARSPHCDTRHRPLPPPGVIWVPGKHCVACIKIYDHLRIHQEPIMPKLFSPQPKFSLHLL